MEKSRFRTESVTVEVDIDDSSISGMKTYSATISIDFSDVSAVGDPFNIGVNHVYGYSAMLAPE